MKERYSDLDQLAVKYLKFQKLVLKEDGSKNKFKIFQDYFITKTSFLVFRNTYKYKKFPNYPDLCQVGFVGLLSAINSYKPDRGGSFSWWAEKYIKTNVYRAANAHSDIKYPMHRAKKHKPHKVNKMPLFIDESACPLKKIEINEIKNNVFGAVEMLSEDHKRAITMVFELSGNRHASTSNVANEMNISKHQYKKLLREAKQTIKKQLSAYGK